MTRDYTPYIGDFEHEYKPVHVQWRDRHANGFMDDARSRQMFVELEYWIEEVIGGEQIRTKKC